MENVNNTSLKWSALDVEAYIDNLREEWIPGEKPLEFFDLGINCENCEELQKMFFEEMKCVIIRNEENIIEYINSLILDHVCDYRDSIVHEIKYKIAPILQAKKTLNDHE